MFRYTACLAAIVIIDHSCNRFHPPPHPLLLCCDREGTLPTGQSTSGRNDILFGATSAWSYGILAYKVITMETVCRSQDATISDMYNKMVEGDRPQLLFQ